MTITQHQLELSGIRTPVLDTGGSSEVVLFLHGNPGCGNDWLPLMHQVAGFCRVVAPDMPGFGQADKPNDFTYTIRLRRPYCVAGGFLRPAQSPSRTS